MRFGSTTSATNRLYDKCADELATNGQLSIDSALSLISDGIDPRAIAELEATFTPN